MAAAVAAAMVAVVPWISVCMAASLKANTLQASACGAKKHQLSLLLADMTAATCTTLTILSHNATKKLSVVSDWCQVKHKLSKKHHLTLFVAP